MNSSSGGYVYQSVRDKKYALVVIDLLGVQFGSSRRDRALQCSKPTSARLCPQRSSLPLLRRE
eukprot:4040438-Lingulodinium_polyedra.AAC.1